MSAGLIYYEFKPAEGVVNAFITSRDDKGSLTSGVSVLDSSRDGKEIKGTAWIDASSPPHPQAGSRPVRAVDHPRLRCRLTPLQEGGSSRAP